MYRVGDRITGFYIIENEEMIIAVIIVGWTCMLFYKRCKKAFRNAFSAVEKRRYLQTLFSFKDIFPFACFNLKLP